MYDNNMSENTKREVAAICGLYCGICPMFPEKCGGCCSDRVISQCKICPAGFRACAKAKGVTRCYECDEFPCDMVEKFNTDGIPHHSVVMENCRKQQKIGLEAWLEAQERDHRCPSCRKLIKWECRSCQECGHRIKGMSL
jgi:hypothetical protein